MRRKKAGIYLTIALEGKPLPPLTADERAIYDLLREQRGWHASAIGLTRWIRKRPDAARADRKIAAAAERLSAGMLIHKDVDDNYYWES